MRRRLHEDWMMTATAAMKTTMVVVATSDAAVAPSEISLLNKHIRNPKMRTYKCIQKKDVVLSRFLIFRLHTQIVRLRTQSLKKQFNASVIFSRVWNSFYRKIHPPPNE